MVTAKLLLVTSLPVAVIFLIVLFVGIAFGALNGFLITYAKFPAFIATLATQYLARGSCYILDSNTIAVSNSALIKISLYKIRLFVGPKGPFISIGVIVSLIVFVIFEIISKHTNFGRGIYALGGNEQSAVLMGLPTKRIKMLVYMLCGATSGVASIVFTIYMLSAFPLSAESLHLDAVSAAVIGGVLTTGGVGIMVRHTIWCPDNRRNPDHHHIPGHALIMVDPHHHGRAPARVHPAAALCCLPTRTFQGNQEDSTVGIASSVTQRFWRVPYNPDRKKQPCSISNQGSRNRHYLEEYQYVQNFTESRRFI